MYEIGSLNKVTITFIKMKREGNIFLEKKRRKKDVHSQKSEQKKKKGGKN